MLVWIGAVSMVIILVTAFKRSAIKENKTELNVRKERFTRSEAFFCGEMIISL